MTKTQKHHTQESQEVIPYPAGDHKIARYNKDKHKTQKRIHIRSITLELSVRILVKGLTCTNLALISDMDPDTYIFGWHGRSLSY